MIEQVPMSKYLEPFVAAIHSKTTVKVIVKRKGKPTPLIATCAPLDYAPPRNNPDSAALFHFYKFAWKHHKAHIMSIEPDMLTKLEVLADTFDPADFIDWDVTQKPWTIERDWGDFS